MSNYLKAIMAVLGTVVSGLSVYYGHDQWYPIVIAAVTALNVYLVPNAPKVYPITKYVAPMTESPQTERDGWSDIK